MYHLYCWRWFMLAALFMLNGSAGMMWLSFSPIPNYTAAFYGVTEDEVNLFSIIYSVTTLIVGFVSILTLDIFGLKVALYFGATCNVLGSIIRWISTISPILCSHDYQRSGFMVAMIGQTITAFAQPFLLYAPTKLASFWFGPKERAICTGIASLGNPIGIAMANMISPLIVQDPQQLPRLMWVYSIPAVIAFILTLLSFWYSHPPVPPGPTATIHLASLQGFLRGLLTSLCSGSMWGLMLIWGTGAGLFNATLTILPQLLCSYGYSNKQAGLWAAMAIFVGMGGAIGASYILDHTRKFKEVGVVSFGLAILCFIWFVEVSTQHDQSVNIAFSLCVFGFFALPLVPVCMELGVEITYPVAEATSSGLLWSSVQVFSILLVLLSNVLQKDLPQSLVPSSDCHLEVLSVSSCILANTTSEDVHAESPKEFTNVMIFYMGLAVGVLLFMILFFKPQYKRVHAELKSASTNGQPLKPVGSFQSVKDFSGHQKPPSSSNDSLQTLDTTYQTAQSCSTYLQTATSNSYIQTS